MKALTPKMLEALEKVDVHGALIRKQGGFWTWPECPTRAVGVGNVAPNWYVGVVVIMGLVDRGLLAITARRAGDDEPIRVERVQ
jgi:hypothetical protein